MALELESTIMAEIGMGNSYMWHNGSGGCGGTARHAAQVLAEKIARHHKDGDGIAAPHGPLLALVTKVAHTEPDQYTLTRTFQACATAIRAHMEATPEDMEPLKQAADYIKRTWLAGYNTMKITGYAFAGGAFVELNEDSYRAHLRREGDMPWNDNPEGCYWCGSINHHSGDCRERE